MKALILMKYVTILIFKGKKFIKISTHQLKHRKFPIKTKEIIKFLIKKFLATLPDLFFI